MPQQRFQVANMSYLQITGLKISYGDNVVLHNIDLAVEQGGNVEGAVAGEVVMRHGVTAADRGVLAAVVPRTREVSATDAEALWAGRRI